MSRPRSKLTQSFPGCAVEATLSLMDGKWKGVILYHLFQGGTLRFSDLRRRLPNVTQRMLTKQLRELEGCGVIARTVFPVVPPRVDYALTPLGLSLQPVVAALKSWGDAHSVCEDGALRFVTVRAPKPEEQPLRRSA
ncbi:winged helix-turn-helix transcriptional regulator [Ensifer soli]|uniref:winged helix-turn-helix transcriptional regulator n=1 Tax=Ciceribacter sp. sgz301302 TaxID=3342379 RepID=UPI0035B92C97